MDNPRSILITGASSGIGEALAFEYAAPHTHLWLSGRNADRLRTVADLCREKGASVAAETIDATDAPAMTRWIAACDESVALDLVIANAGIAGGDPATEADAPPADILFAVNVGGVLNTVQPAIRHMRSRRAGQIAIVSSLASFRGVPGAPAYSASKAAVRVWGEALRARHREDGIAVSVICPGFVVSRITDRNLFPMPLLMTADRAALIIRRGLARNRGRIAFPWPTYLVSWLLGVLPPALGDRLLRNAPRKE